MIDAIDEDPVLNALMMDLPLILDLISGSHQLRPDG
jgi:hypothetical protein